MAAVMDPIPGTSDLWEPEVLDWVQIEDCARKVLSLYGFNELRTPIFERTELFVRGIGDQTEVVQKEMYTFEDRGHRSLTLRPEGTAGVMRAILHQGVSEGEEKRVFYMGPMFRGEKPAAGRKRQFHQIGVEAVGTTEPGRDAESIAMLVHFLDDIGISDARILLNTRGTAADREAVADALYEYFKPRVEGMCPDCQRRLGTNVWRMMDCKQEACQPVIHSAPRIVDLVGEESRSFFMEVCKFLDELGLEYELDPRLVRGLDYYEHTVFEVVHSGLGAQDAIAGGGRYKMQLPGQNRPIEGVGWAVGIERLLLARESLGIRAEATTPANVYVAVMGAAAAKAGLELVQELRRHDIKALSEVGRRSLKAQMRTANKLGAPLALILGDSELSEGTVVCKNMATSEQETVKRTDIAQYLLSKILSI